jgi:hypothetical protein
VRNSSDSRVRIREDEVSGSLPKALGENLFFSLKAGGIHDLWPVSVFINTWISLSLCKKYF